MRSLPALAALCVLFAYALPYIPHASAAPKDWTILVYMDADNNLEDVGIDDFLEMASVGSTSEINVVVQVDRIAGFVRSYGDWTTARRYYVTQGMVPDNASALMELGEVNMADPATLTAFVNWGIGNYPADHYFLVLWDHGDGWQGVVVDDDPVPGDRLTAGDLSSAMASIAATNGRRVDLLGNDACRMTLEILYEVADYVDFLVGSEKDEPLEGWPYDTFLTALAASPSMEPAQVASTLVDKYVESYELTSPYSVTLSAVNAAGLRPMVADLDAFLDELAVEEPYFTREVVEARDATEHYEIGGGPGGLDYDLYHFLENVIDRIPSRRLERLADAFFTSFQGAIVRERHWDNPNPVNQVHAADAHGISLWFPTIGGDPTYALLRLSGDSRWDEFLATYPIGSRAQVEVPVTASATTLDGNGDSLLDVLQVSYNGINGTVSVDFYRDDVYWLSAVYRAESNRTYTQRYDLVLGGYYEVSFYFVASGDLVNLTTWGALPIEEMITFRGAVTGRDGAPLDGGTVTLTHLPSGRTAVTTVAGGAYSVSVPYPTWFERGDPMLLLLEAGDRRVSVTFNATFAADKTVVQDLFVDAVGNGPWLVGVIVLGVAAVLGVALGLFYRQKFLRFKKIP